MDKINQLRHLNEEKVVLELKLEHSMRIDGIISEKEKPANKVYTDHITKLLKEIKNLIDNI